MYQNKLFVEDEDEILRAIFALEQTFLECYTTKSTLLKYFVELDAIRIRYSRKSGNSISKVLRMGAREWIEEYCEYPVLKHKRDFYFIDEDDALKFVIIFGNRG